MENSKNIEANRYLIDRTKRVYVDRCNILGIETFEQYLNHRYRDSCYNYSLYAIMGLKNNDILLRGYIDVEGSGRSNYHHGWVEFTFKEEEYVFDNHFKCVVLKKEWYKIRKPLIDYQKTQKEILEQFLNETYAFEVAEGFWQLKEVVYAGYKDFRQINDALKFSEDEGYVPATLQRARVVVSKYSGEVTRFIAFDPPQG